MFTVNDPPVDGVTTVKVTRSGRASAGHREYHAHRNLAGGRRVAAADRAQLLGPYRARQEMVQAAAVEQPRDGNITEAPPDYILRQALHERRKAERYEPDVSAVLTSVIDLARAMDTVNTKLNGGIHHIGKAPLCVHNFTEHALRRYR